MKKIDELIKYGLTQYGYDREYRVCFENRDPRIDVYDDDALLVRLSALPDDTIKVEKFY